MSRGEVVIADNGSNDGSQQIARDHGARVIEVAKRGYGHALRAGIHAARGRYIIMGDSDDSYDFSELGPFVDRLRGGYDLVMGNRFRGGILPGAMPWLHRYVGNPLLTGILNLFFRSPIGDAHCGLRAFPKASCAKLGLVTHGMEFASEMVVKASVSRQKITEVPIVLHPDGRDRAPHLRSFPRWMATPSVYADVYSNVSVPPTRMVLDPSRASSYSRSCHSGFWKLRRNPWP